MNPEQFTRVYVKFHNAACAEFKLAFAEVGARMWNADDAHLLKPKHEEFILQEVMRLWETDNLQIIYGKPVTRPLTVLDSYPEVTVQQRRQLNIKVDEITLRYNREFQKLTGRQPGYQKPNIEADCGHMVPFDPAWPLGNGPCKQCLALARKVHRELTKE